MIYLRHLIFLLAFFVGSDLVAQQVIEPIIKPGYRPGSDAKMDERGIWMEMEEAELDLKRSPLIVRNGSLDTYVDDLACHVAGDYCSDLRFYVIRNPHFNASMAPNGTVLIHTGLIARITSSDQLAAVLGHELAHYTQTHSIRRLRAAKRRMTVGMLFSVGLAVGGIPGSGLPEIFALSSVMGFTRKQELEADLIGAMFTNNAGYDPQHSAIIWRLLEAEEQHASIKRDKGPIWFSSHPTSTKRAKKLDKISAALIRPTNKIEHMQEDPLRAVLEQNYELVMDEQAKLRDFGRFSTLVDRHDEMGIRPSLIAFYRGESWRFRGGAGDHEKAIAQYRLAIADEESIARAYKELGYLLYKHGEKEEAKEHFVTYLKKQPDADDREMIEFYLGDGW
ncbi:MAG: M48 family metalloprotease [Gammaproteobacteria bacterium]|nr:M48 family metalloprotease [Gammaproteobacteria bacterium]